MQTKEKVTSVLLLLPLLIEWIPGITSGLTLEILGLPFYWPNLFIILYFFLSPFKHLTKIQKTIRNNFLILLLYMPLSLLIFEDGRHALGLYIVSLQFFLILFAFSLRPPSLAQIYYLRKIIIFLYIYLSAQMILSSLGIWQYTETAVSNDSMQFARASTKLGDCNQSSIILFLLTVIITNFYVSHRFITFILIGVTFSSIAMVATRGALISISIYLVAYTMIGIKRRSFKYKFSIAAGILALSLVVVKFNILNDVINRQAELNEVGNVTSGRDGLILYTLETSFKDSPIIGVGPNRVFPMTRTLCSARNSGLRISQYSGAPHNTWVLILCSFGLLGLIIFLNVIVRILRKLDYHNPFSWAILSIFVINMNTEAIMFYGEIFTFTCIMITGALKKNKYEDTGDF